MKKNVAFKRNRLSQAVTLACLSAVSVPAMAGDGSCADGANTISDSRTELCTLNSGDSLTLTSSGSITTTLGESTVFVESATISSINNGGVIDSDEYGIYAFGSSISDGIFNVDGGMIESSNAGIYLLNSSAGTIDNAGTILSGGPGIYLMSNGGISTVGSINNSGVIDALTNSGDNGIYVFGDVTGSISNTGTIIGDEHGIYLYSSRVGGSILNDGFLEAEDEAAIYLMHTEVAGDVINNGSIIGGNSGIKADNFSIGGELTNNGYIYGDSSVISLLDGVIGGNLTNAGFIDLDTSSSGMYLQRVSVGGSLINSGTIYSDESSGQGIYLGQSRIGGDLINSGLIDTSADGGDSGIYLHQTTVGGSIINSGRILTRDTDATDGGHGIYLQASTVRGDVLNSGTIDAYEQGVYVQGTVIFGSLINSGYINSRGDNGIYINNGSTVTGIVNSGFIGATGGTSGENAIYIHKSAIGTGGIINSGTIQSDDYSGIKLYRATVAGDVVNTGLIDSYEDGLYLYRSTIAGNVDNSGVIDTSDNNGLHFDYSTVGGAVTNTGAILADDGYGLYLYYANFSEGMSNSGTILSDESALYFYESFIGSDVVNSGTIISDDELGIHLSYSQITGGITNTGLIDADGNGIYTYYSRVGGDILNSGRLVSAGESGISIYSSSIAGGIYNDGVIEAEDEGVYVAYARLSGSIINSGTIITTESGPGIRLQSDALVGGDLINMGVIRASDGAGIYLSDDSAVGGQIVNSGDIFADYAGMYVFTDSATAQVINSGLIVAGDQGIYLHSGSTVGDLVNSGTIQSEGFGIYVYDGSNESTVTGNILNSGVIESEKVALYLNNVNVDGQVLNTGKLIGGAYVYGNNLINIGLLNTRDNNSLIQDANLFSSGEIRTRAVDTSTFGTFEVTQQAELYAGSYVSVAFDTAHTLVAGDVLNDVLTAGTLVDTGAMTRDNLLNLNVTKTIDGNTVDLTVVETSLESVERSAGIIGLKRGYELAVLVDEQMASDPYGDLAFAFGGFSTDAEVASALETLLPAFGGGIGEASLAIGNDVADVVAARQGGGTGLASGDETSLNRNFWIAGFGGTAEQSKRDGLSGYEIDTDGFAFGADVNFTDTFNLGLAVAKAQSDVEGDAGSNVEADSTVYTLYATFNLSEATDLDLQIGMGDIENSSVRNTLMGTATADYDSELEHFGAKLSHKMGDDGFAFTPYLALRTVTVDVDGYQENGGLGLLTQDTTSDSKVVSLGVDTVMGLGDRLDLLADLGVGYDLDADETKVTTNFAGGGQLLTEGVNPAEVVYDLGLGLRYSMDNGTSVRLGYDYTGREDYTDQYASLKVNFKF